MDSAEGAADQDRSVPPKPKNSGRLELTWSNKDKALLSHEDGTYEWVPKRDHRVAEVRLLRDAGTVGEVHSDEERAKDNLLIRGESLNALTALTSSPEFAEEYVGKVKLVYIDPPFNTGQAFEHYDDGLEHSVWLTMMRDRLLKIKELLAPDGSVWVHLDDAEVAYCRVLMDEVFGRENFVATIVWQKVYARENRKAISVSQDYIICFARNEHTWKGARNLLPREAADLAVYKNPDNDPRGLWRPDNFTAQAGRAPKSQFYSLKTPDGRVLDPPPGTAWRMNQARYEEMLRDNRLWFGSDGKGRPALKRFLTEVQDGLVPMSWWPYQEVGHNQEAKKEILAMFPKQEPFDTPKPERLMKRIIHIGSNPGDIVLDCFAGSGTTAAVAHKMDRRWVTIEWEQATIDTFTAPRLEKVIKGEDPGGITASTEVIADGELPEGVAAEDASRFSSLLGKFSDLLEELDEEEEIVDIEDLSPKELERLEKKQKEREKEKKLVKAYVSRLRKAAKTKKKTETKWEGGGGFRVLDVAPSIFEDDEGIVVLADWVTDHDLGQAVAAQLGFDYEPDQPFCGRQGKLRLAVIDGHVDKAAIQLLVQSLGKDEKLSVCATSLDPDAAKALKKMSRGSQARVVPQDILLSYRTPSSWQVSVSVKEEE